MWLRFEDPERADEQGIADREAESLLAPHHEVAETIVRAKKHRETGAVRLQEGFPAAHTGYFHTPPRNFWISGTPPCRTR